jgi:hypothetical protein
MKNNMSAAKQLIAAVTILAVVAVVLLVLNFTTRKESEVVINGDGNFTITGMYGKTIGFNNVHSIKLKDPMPAIGTKTNGAGLGDVNKGYFDVSGVGNSLLFVHTSKGPFIFIETNERMVIINYKDADKTKSVYDKLLIGWQAIID